MRLKKEVGASTLAFGVLATGMGVANSATAVTVLDGGTWNYGNTATWNYSDFHYHFWHQSTVKCGGDTMTASAAGGKWSNAGMWRVSGCSYYYAR